MFELLMRKSERVISLIESYNRLPLPSQDNEGVSGSGCQLDGCLFRHRQYQSGDA